MTAHAPLRGDVAVLVPAAGMGVRLGPGGPKALRLPRWRAPARARRPPAGRRAQCRLHRRRRAAPTAGRRRSRAMLARAYAAAVRLIVVAGGATRQASVAAALAAVPAEFDIVLVHDAARA